MSNNKTASNENKSASKKTSKPGLYANIHKAQVRAANGGRPVREKGDPGAPTDEAFRKAAKTAKDPLKSRPRKTLQTKKKPKAVSRN